MKIAVLSIENDPDRAEGAEARASRLLRQLGLAVENAITSGDDVEPLMEVWQKFDVVFLVDAEQSGLPGGTLRVLDAVPTKLGSGISRDRRIEGTLGLYRLLDQLPRRMVLCSGEGDHQQYGCALSPKGDAGGGDAPTLTRDFTYTSELDD